MNFDVEVCKKYVETLINHDEVERALSVLDNLPSYYRDHYPPELALLRKQILGAICTSHAYMSDGLDCEVTKEAAVFTLNNQIRGLVVKGEMARYKAQDLKPHIIDMGPGEYFIPIGLKEEGFEFTYNDIGFDPNTKAQAEKYIGSLRQKVSGMEQPQVFIAFEVIEHLHNTKDIVTECLRHSGGFPERILLSTPCYTFDMSEKDWRKKSGLPHLRSYTPKEFVDEAQRLFPYYVWQFYDGPVMTLRGMRNDKIDNTPL